MLEIRRAYRDRVLERAAARARYVRVLHWLFMDYIFGDAFYGETAEESFAWRWEAFVNLRRDEAPERIVARVFDASHRAASREYVADRLEEKAAEMPPRVALAMDSFAHRQRLRATRYRAVTLPTSPSAPRHSSDTTGPEFTARFTRLELPVHSPKPRDDAPRVQPRGWMVIAPFGELLWQQRELFVLDEDARVRLLAQVDDATFAAGDDRDEPPGLCTPAFDGRYVWTALPRNEPLLIVVDMRTGNTATFDASDGLAGVGACMCCGWCSATAGRATARWSSVRRRRTSSAASRMRGITSAARRRRWCWTICVRR